MSQDPDGRQYRRELLETIDSQKQTIEKYETRLKDVVRAYKGLVKEKEALEASLKAISMDVSSTAQDGSNVQGNPDVDASFVAGGEVDSKARLEVKVKTLTSALATVTAEKSRLEAEFQEDRRRLNKEWKGREKVVDALQKELSALKAKTKAETDELKSKVIVERHEREKETSDHAVMIRELQKLLADERRGKERLEGMLMEAQKSKAAAATSGGGESTKKQELESEKRARDLEMKLRLMTEEAQRAKRELSKITPELDKMRKDMAEVKASHEREMEKADRRAEAADVRASSARVEQERRVNSLEARLQELSETVGTYDRLRQHDQSEIKKLKEKLDRQQRPDVTATPVPPAVGKEEERQQDSVQVLLEKFYRLRKKLRELNERSSNPVEDLEALINDEASAKWKREYEAAREELEALKKRASVPLPSPSSSGRYLLPEVDQEVILSLKTQASELQDRNTALKMQLLSSEKEKGDLSERVRELREDLRSVRMAAKEKVDAMENEYRGKVIQLETELQKQRERCLTLIEEKEDEVRLLKASMESAFEEAFASPPPAAADKNSQLRLFASVATTSRSTSLTDGLKSSNTGDGGMVLHYAQELSHRDVEISSLRQRVFDLESAMRELQLSAVAKEEKYVEEIETLQEAVARLRRMSPSREGANMEYLKNVVLSYMLSSDAGSREHMLKAIGAVLLFSRNDFKRVRDYNAAWWWSHGQKK